MPHIKTKKKRPIGSTCCRRGGESQCYTNSKAPVRKRYNNVQDGIVYVVCMNVRMRAMPSGSVYTSHPGVGSVYRLMSSGVLEMLTFGISVFVKSFAEN